jgi:hypothetical protein
VNAGRCIRVLPGHPRDLNAPVQPLYYGPNLPIAPWIEASVQKWSQRGGRLRSCQVPGPNSISCIPDA